MKHAKNVVVALVTGGAMVLSSVAMAAPATDLPPEAVAFIADIQTYATAMLAKFWPLALIVLGGFTAFKLVRKGINKAT